MFSTGGSSAVGEAIGGRGDCARTSTIESQGLPDCRPVPGDALYRDPTGLVGRDAPVVTALNDTVERRGRGAGGFLEVLASARSSSYM